MALPAGCGHLMAGIIADAIAHAAVPGPEGRDGGALDGSTGSLGADQPRAYPAAGLTAAVAGGDAARRRVGGLDARDESDDRESESKSEIGQFLAHDVLLLERRPSHQTCLSRRYGGDSPCKRPVCRSSRRGYTRTGSP